jgi:very-short-patch-repair endonuclease
MSPDEAIAAIAAKQHGAFTNGQAVEAGLTAPAIHHRRTSGRWVDLHRAVYAMAGAPRTDEQRIIAAVLSLGPRAVAASITAARLYGIVDRTTDLIYVLLPIGQHRRTRRGIHIRSAALTRVDVRTVKGIPLTCPERTIVDLAAVLAERAIEAALDDAVQLGLTTVPKVRRYIRARNLEHRPGMKLLNRLLDDRTTGVPQKELEKMFLRKLRAAKLPEPVRQQPCGDHFIDFAYPDRSIAIELYGRAWHFSGRAFREDPRRWNRIVLAGWRTLLVFTWEDVDERWPDVEATLRRALTN